MADDCVFCRIAAGLLPAHVVHQDDDLVAFLDINPIRPGHTQIIPRRHFAYFDELPPDLAARVVTLGQELARVMKRIYAVRRVSLCFTGADIAHAHAHIVPLVSTTDITSRRYIAEEKITFRPTPRMPDEELARTAQDLRQALA